MTPNQRPVHVAVLYALDIEAGSLVDRLADVSTLRGEQLTVRLGHLDEQRVAVAITGAGDARAERGTEAIIDAHQPRWVIAAGLSGGLTPEVHRHAIVMADRIVNPAGDTLTTGLRIEADELKRFGDVHLGRVLSWPNVVRRVEDKRELGERYDARAVDMESFAVADTCRRRGVGMICVRAIGDPVDEQLPADVERLLQKRPGAAQWGAAAAAVLRRPGAVKDFWRLRENTILTAERLAEMLVGVIPQLPAP